MFWSKKKKFISQNAEYLSTLLDLPSNITADFLNSVSYTDVQWEISRIVKGPVDCREVCQSICEMVIDASLSDPPFLGVIVDERLMKEEMVKLFTAKISAEYVGQGFPHGSEAEAKLFKKKLEFFLKTKTRQASGSLVTLMEFIVDPIGHLPISEESRNKLLGD